MPPTCAGILVLSGHLARDCGSVSNFGDLILTHRANVLIKVLMVRGGFSQDNYIALHKKYGTFSAIAGSFRPLI